MGNEKNNFRALDLNEKRLPAFETERRSSLIKPVTAIYSGLKKLIIMSPNISTVENLANAVHQALSPHIEGLSVMIVSFEGVVKTMGKSIDVNEDLFQIIWTRQGFGRKEILLNDIDYKIYFSSFKDDVYLMLATTEELSFKDHHVMVTALKNFPNLLGRGI
jgi:hypothetical protein